MTPNTVYFYRNLLNDLTRISKIDVGYLDEKSYLAFFENLKPSKDNIIEKYYNEFHFIKESKDEAHSGKVGLTSVI